MKRFWQAANIVALVFALGANFLVGAQLLGTPAIGDISDTYATYLTPAGYAFSIWSIVYVWLVVVGGTRREIYSGPQHATQCRRQLVRGS